MPIGGLQALLFGRDASREEVLLPLVTGVIGVGLALS
jgi:hypothetical protein